MPVPVTKPAEPVPSLATKPRKAPEPVGVPAGSEAVVSPRPASQVGVSPDSSSIAEDTRSFRAEARGVVLRLRELMKLYRVDSVLVPQEGTLKLVQREVIVRRYEVELELEDE